MPDYLIRSPGLDQNTSEAFKRKLVRIGERLGLNAGYIGAVMSFETGGTFDPAQKNLAGSGAVGLIQWLPRDETGMTYAGVTTNQLASMSAIEQLDYVEKWFAPVASRLKAPGDYYLAVFSPAFIGSPPETIMFSAAKEPKKYAQNKGLDTDGDGLITVGDVVKKFSSFVAKAESLPPIEVKEVSNTSPRAFQVVALGLTIFSLSRLRWLARRQTR